MGMEIVREINSCRSCGFDKLTPILSLGDLYVSDFVDVSERKKGIKSPLELVLCNKKDGGCGLLQLKHTVSGEEMYREYWYRSGINKSMTDELTDIVKKLEAIVPIKPGDFVIDIGSNDGTLLRAYDKSKKLKLVGFEPAKNLEEVGKKDIDKLFVDFFNFPVWNKEFGGAKAKIITAIAMFYDLDDPNAFVDDIVKSLDDDGVFVIQMMYLPLFIKRNAFDGICVKPDTIILGDNKPINEVPQGGYAFGENGKLNKIVNVMWRSYQGDLVHVKPTYLEPITITPEHPLRIVKKEFLHYHSGQLKPEFKKLPLEWVPAGQVKRGDYVVVPKLASEQSNSDIDLSEFNRTDSSNYRRGLRSLPLNKDTAWLMGLYVAEGFTGGEENKKYINFTLHKKEENFAKKIEAIFQTLGYSTNKYFLRKETSKAMEVRATCTALARAFQDWFGKGAVNKHIPDFLMTSSEEIKTAFLRGLFDGDGYIKGNKVHFHTSSKTLALQVQLLTASLGGMLGISYVKPYPRIIRGGQVKSKDSWQLRGSSKSLASIFNYKHKGVDITHAIVEDDYILVPVKKVEREKYKGHVHNIETHDNTYLVSNAVVHNCHEHLEYYSLSSLEKLLNRHGLEVCDVEMREHVNEGSIRVYARKIGKGNSLNFEPGAEERVERVCAEEEDLRLNGKEVYEQLAERVLEAKEKTISFIKQEVAKGKKIHGYAASTKGNTTLQFYGLTPDLIEAIADRNPVKWGKFTVGTMIPVISEEDSRAQEPDYYFVLAWHFLPEFIKRESEFLKNGGKFIVPMPEFKVIDSSALSLSAGSDLPSEVTIFESDYSFEHADDRRAIHGVVGDFKFPFSLRQIKTIEFSPQSIEKKLIVGNHGHKIDSGQWEIIFILGSDKEDYFLFRHRNKPGGEVKERKLKGGDFILVPPGSTFAFMAIRNGARLIEVSNKEYDAINYLTDSLF